MNLIAVAQIIGHFQHYSGKLTIAHNVTGVRE